MTAPTAKTPNVRRVLKEIQELEADSSDRYSITIPFEDDIFQLHFTIRGPSGTPYEAGVYHGRLVLPPQYPFKPPEIYFLTPNGRFETKTKICLSISSFHEESWNPSWGLRTMLLGIASFMAFESEGAIGSVRWTDDERRDLAQTSHKWTCSECGKANDEILPVCGELRPLRDKDKGEPALQFVYERDRQKGQSPSQPAVSEADSGVSNARDGESGKSASEGEARDTERPTPASRAAIQASGSVPKPRSPSPSTASASRSSPARSPTTTASTNAASRAHEHEQSQAKLDVMIVAVLFVIMAILLRKIF